MSTTIEATFDGTVFHPTTPVSLSPNTIVRLTIEDISNESQMPMSFLETARAAHLQGPPDWASNLDKYLYGGAMLDNEVFLDAVYAVALAADSDQLHEQALRLSEHLEREGTRLVKTRAVLLEIGNGMSKKRFRATGVRILSALENDPLIEIIDLTPQLFAEALNLYKTRTDKEWGLIDCLSFVVMNQLGIREALTSDQHFEQAGFRVLLHNI